jgi:hypothetical protein
MLMSMRTLLIVIGTSLLAAVAAAQTLPQLNLRSAGLQALDYLDRSEPSPEPWRAQQLMLIEQAKTPKADLLLIVVAPIQQLIEASGSPTRQQ